jgi:hypothetical protein
MWGNVKGNQHWLCCEAIVTLSTRSACRHLPPATAHVANAISVMAGAGAVHFLTGSTAQ